MQPEQAPPPDYNFILQDKPPVKRSLVSGMPKGLVFGAGAVIVVLILILLFGLIFGHKSSGTAAIMESLGRSQEISRVTEDQSQKLKGTDALSLATTTQASMTSDQAQFTDWLAKHKVKVDAKNLVIYKDSVTDQQLQQAAQNNNLDSAYLTYLQKALAEYATTLSNAYRSSSSPTAKVILKESFNSTQTLRSAWAAKP